MCSRFGARLLWVDNLFGAIHCKLVERVFDVGVFIFLSKQALAVSFVICKEKLGRSLAVHRALAKQRVGSTDGG